MTENERSQIVALQYKGYGYKRIAAETGLALNTVIPTKVLLAQTQKSVTALTE